jgi:type II secretory pathway component GspD/PulD (secretin)
MLSFQVFATPETKQKIKSKVKKSKPVFFVSCVDQSPFVVAEAITDFYKVNIFIAPRFMSKKITFSYEGNNIKSLLDSLAFTLDCSWRFENNNIYFSNADTRLVKLPNYGLRTAIITALGNIKGSIVKDSIVINGSESDIKSASKIIKAFGNRKLLKLKVSSIEFLCDDGLELGIDIKKSFSYFFSTANFLKDFDPTTHLALSVVASLKASAKYARSTVKINSVFQVLSGDNIHIEVGEELDRELYSESGQGNVNRVKTGFSTQKTGLLINISPFYDEAKKTVFINFEASNSTAITDLQRKVTKIKTFAVLKHGQAVIVADLNLDGRNISYENGIPFLCKIPWLGYFFRVTNTLYAQRKVIFILQLIK